MLHLPLSFPGWEGDLFSDFMAMPGYGSCRGSACAAPHLCRPAAAAPTFRVLRAAPAFPEPEEPEVYISRTVEGVLAACPLGRAFSRDDISLDLEGRDLTITAWRPQTRHWRAYGRERPAAYQRTLELAPHLDAQRMKARLDTATGTLELFFPYRRMEPAPQPRTRVVVVQQSTVAAPVPPAAPAPRPSLVRVSAPAPAPRVPLPPTQPAAAPAPTVTPAAAPVPAAEMEADDASAMAQRAHRRRQRHHHAQRRRSSSPKQTEQACPTCCCQAASPAPAPPALQQQQQQQPKAQPRVIPIECGQPSSAAAAEPQRKAAQRSRPSSPVAAPVESPRSEAASPSASAAASPSAAAKGKGLASPEQVAKWQRQQRAAAAAKRIAAGVASDSDWEDADGSVSECGLDD